MFENCGKIIKTIAIIFFALCIVGAVAVLIAECVDLRAYLFGNLGTLLIVEAVILVAGFISSVMIYGFGEIVDCVKELRNHSK